MGTIEGFADITRTVIADSDIEEFLPTVLYPARKKFGALEGNPVNADIEAIAVSWAGEGALTAEEEILVAFRVSSDEFRIVRLFNEQMKSATSSVGPSAPTNG